MAAKPASWQHCVPHNGLNTDDTESSRTPADPFARHCCRLHPACLHAPAFARTAGPTLGFCHPLSWPLKARVLLCTLTRAQAHFSFTLVLGSHGRVHEPGFLATAAKKHAGMHGMQTCHIMPPRGIALRWPTSGPPTSCQRTSHHCVRSSVTPWVHPTLVQAANCEPLRHRSLVKLHCLPRQAESRGEQCIGPAASLDSSNCLASP